VRTAAEPGVAGRASQAGQAEGAVYAFIAAVGAGEAVTAASCFTREGCLITPDGTAVHGRGEIAGILAQLIARRTEIEIERLAIRLAGDVALGTGHLKMRSDAAEGAHIVQACDPTIALRRVEGTWKLAILAPWAFHERH
jgi:ketosteroid isomerase-like protein